MDVKLSAEEEHFLKSFIIYVAKCIISPALISSVLSVI